MAPTIAVSAPPQLEFLSRGPLPMLIGGEWVQAQSGQTFETVNPATGQVITTVASAASGDVDLAVTAARRAAEDPAWRDMNPHERTRVLLRIADAIDEQSEELALIESIDAGLPISTTRAMIPETSRVVRYYAGWPTKLTGTVHPVDASVHCYSVREPIGVCAGIIPWNASASMSIWKIIPALATGNSVILKPAEQTPLTALRLGQIMTDCGLPPGVVNIVTGYGETAGAAIAQHRGIDKVAFTGSTITGKKILEASLGNLKRVTLELGGKSPHIIMPDADIEQAARYAAVGFAMMSGQACVAGTRILVHASIHDEFAEALAKQLSFFRVGDPLADDTVLGPLVSAEQFAKVTSYIALGHEEGARPIIGGEKYDSPGYFVQPTVFGQVDNNMRLAREEIFGPVAALMTFNDVEDAVRIANDTDYGLAAAVATTNVSKAHSLARRLRAGVVWVNTYLELDSTFPFGGFKQSGIGRELAEKSLDNFTELKSIFVRL